MSHENHETRRGRKRNHSHRNFSERHQSAADALLDLMDSHRVKRPVEDVLAYAKLFENIDEKPFLKRTDFNDERYVQCLYEQCHFWGASSSEFVALWAEAKRFDPKRDILCRLHKFTMLDSIYRSMRNATLVRHFLKPRPVLDKSISASPTLKAMLHEDSRKKDADDHSTNLECVKDFVRNSTLVVFVIYSMPMPLLNIWPIRTPFSVALLWPYQSLLLIGCIFNFIVCIFGVTHHKDSHTHTSPIASSSIITRLAYSIRNTLVDVVVFRWLGVFSLAFLLSLIDIVLNNLGALIFFWLSVTLWREKCAASSVSLFFVVSAALTYSTLKDFSLMFWSFKLVQEAIYRASLGSLPFLSPSNGLPQTLNAALLCTSFRNVSALDDCDYFLVPGLRNVLAVSSSTILSLVFWQALISHGVLNALAIRVSFDTLIALVVFISPRPFVSKAHVD